VILACLFVPVRALACACCSNSGDYQISFRSAADYELEEMQRMRFGRTAFLFETEAGMDEDALGITQPKPSYLVQGSLVGKTWKIKFGSGTNSGTLELPLPEKMLSFAVDIHDGKRSGGGGPLLYKEWRFEGEAKGSGIFQRGISGQVKYFLVLQGRGNACNNAEDFGNWRLEIRGDKAKFAFYGRMGKTG
jgi:hypothetical protein